MFFEWIKISIISLRQNNRVKSRDNSLQKSINCSCLPHFNRNCLSTSTQSLSETSKMYSYSYSDLADKSVVKIDLGDCVLGDRGCQLISKIEWPCLRELILSKYGSIQEVITSVLRVVDIFYRQTGQI